MGKLTVRTIGDPVLEKKAAPVEEFDDALRRFLDEMWDTMRVEDGIGLAAPQVGVSRRIVVIELDGRKLRLVNPVIADRRGRSKGMEACLSVPDLQGEVERADWIRLEYRDEHGEAQELEAEGLLARCIQHECDHLDGILFVNRLAPSKRLMLKKKIKELRQETKRKLAVLGAAGAA